MTTEQKAEAWDQLKQVSFELSRGFMIFGHEFKTEKNKTAKDLLDIMVHVEMSVQSKAPKRRPPIEL